MSTVRNLEESGELFTRDGHLSELSSNAYLLNELNEVEAAILEEHLHSCLYCTQRLRELERLDAAFLEGGFGEPAWLEGATKAKSKRAIPRVALLVALAAAMLLVVWLGGPEQEQPDLLGEDPIAVAQNQEGADTVRVKGKQLSLVLYRKRGKKSQRLSAGDMVYPGDNIGFMVFHRRPGFLMIVGVDASDSAYLYYPQGSRASAAKLKPSQGEGVDLKAAIALDDVLGRERFIAILCPHDFGFEAVESHLLSQPSAKERFTPFSNQCQQQEIHLDKVSKAPR